MDEPIMLAFARLVCDGDDIEDLRRFFREQLRALGPAAISPAPKPADALQPRLGSKERPYPHWKPVPAPAPKPANG